MKAAEDIHPVDKHVGDRVRSLRIHRGMNQSQLAAKLHLTFQQVQKYEKGTNRISCSKLFLICEALAVTPAYFFADMATTDARAIPEAPAFPTLPARLHRALSKVPATKLALLAEVAEAMTPAA